MISNHLTSVQIRHGALLGSVVKRLRHSPFKAVLTGSIPSGVIIFGDVAQSVEQQTVNLRDVGSSPIIPAIPFREIKRKGGVRHFSDYQTGSNGNA